MLGASLARAQLEMVDETDPPLEPDPSAEPEPDRTASAETARLREIVEDCLERYDAGGERVVEEACAQHPELAARIRKRLAILRGAGLLAGNAPETDRPPERLGDFELLERLGAGGMGVVYLAEQSSLARTVALKLIRPENLFFPGARERFQREVEAVSRLQHPGIVQVFVVGEAQGVPYFAMEHVRGCSLAGALAQLARRKPEELTGRDLLELCCAGAGQAPPEERLAPPLFAGSWVQTCARIVQQVAQALEHAHGRGILHRDVKPSNVMVAPDGRVVLLDFGLARAEGVAKLTRSGALLGSLHYAAPEQLRNPLQVDARTDVYALGVTFYELLALRAPYDAETGEALQALIQQGDAPPLRARNSAVPWDAETICLAAMERDPARRYPSALDLARDLSNFLAFLPTAAKRPGASLRLRRWTQRHPARATALALIALGALLGPLLFALQQMAANREIERALGRAQREEQVANEALDLMREQERRSKRSLEQALEAVDRMLTRFAAEAMARSPELDGLRRDLLADAAALLGELDASNPGDDKLQMTLAMTRKRCGDVHRRMGQLAEARAAFERALATYERMHAVYPERAMIERLAGGALNALGAVATELGDEVAAREAFQRARRWMAASRREHPDEIDIGSEMAAAAQNLALLHQAAGELAAAETLLDEAVAVRRELVARSAEEEDLRVRLAMVLVNRGKLLRAARRHDAAGADLHAARELLEPLARRAEPEAQTCATLAAVHQALGSLCVAAGRLEDARASFEGAIAVWEALVSRFTERPHYRLSLGVAQAELAEILSGDTARQTALFDAGVELLESAHALAPSSESRVRLGQVHLKRGRASLRRDPSAAEEDFRRARELELQWLEERPEDPQRKVQVALAEHHLGLAQHALGRPDEALRSARGALARISDLSPEIARGMLGPAALASFVVFAAQLSFETQDRARGVATLREGLARGAVERTTVEALAARGAISAAELEAIAGGR
jgi:serine/threonine protein kinase